MTDGPYLETKVAIGGFWVIDAPDLDVALTLAAEGSQACRGKVEVRPFDGSTPSPLAVASCPSACVHAEELMDPSIPCQRVRESEKPVFCAAERRSTEVMSHPTAT